MTAVLAVLREDEEGTKRQAGAAYFADRVKFVGVFPENQLFSVVYFH